HFEVPEQARHIEGMIAPTHDGGVYYTPPSDDFSRPGRMWWSVPDDANTFTTWRELTTVYHEGAPGHHLQTSSAIAAREERMLLVPQFAAFCDFLIVERLWDSSSLRPAELRRALAGLEFDVVEAADDASRRSAG
ncbi:DUF885 domain-containing protein, partial [Cutibacterium acnes subsp. acnes]|nr:DUF885 domain-containing protein [Cutibacterium acnes subsp. acnes]